MKPCQVVYRLCNKLGIGCRLGVSPSNNITDIRRIEIPAALDFDTVFLARFSVDELMDNKITFLHSSKNINWKTNWEFKDKSDLWNFNLHYFEYLFPLIKAWKDTRKAKYLDKTIEIIDGWIHVNSIGVKPAWSSYTTSLRIVSWISYYGYVSEELPVEFKNRFLKNLHDQYVYLCSHLEKDILGNHYFENLKSIVIAALFFKDEIVLSEALNDFKTECKEEILPDGMHFELSPMYHKIVFEGMLRVSLALRGAGKNDKQVESYLQSMLDVAFSFENGLDRIPLFNDGGNNIAKSLNALVITSAEHFNLKAHFKSVFEVGGFYIFNKKVNGKQWKLIVDAGQPGPKYIPGHVHCDAMSYELFCDGKPILVNCGTYAYQCKERNFYRSTAAHNTVMVANTEQSQFWGVFRLAKRSSTRVVKATNSSITMEMIDQKKHIVQRKIFFTDKGLSIIDSSDYYIVSFIHVTSLGRINAITGTRLKREDVKTRYAEDYGLTEEITTLIATSAKQFTVSIDLEELLLE